MIPNLQVVQNVTLCTLMVSDLEPRTHLIPIRVHVQVPKLGEMSVIHTNAATQSQSKLSRLIANLICKTSNPASNKSSFLVVHVSGKSIPTCLCTILLLTQQLEAIVSWGGDRDSENNKGIPWATWNSIRLRRVQRLRLQFRPI